MRRNTINNDYGDGANHYNNNKLSLSMNKIQDYNVKTGYDNRNNNYLSMKSLNLS